MSDGSKKHHFVPRSLLKNFCNEDGRLFVFDKTTKKSFSSTIENAGHENHFNSIDLEGTKLNFEKLFDEIDSDQAVLIRKLIAFENQWKLTETEKWKLAYFTMVQSYRTKLNRTSIVELSASIQDWVNELNKNGAFEPMDIGLGMEQSKIISIGQIEDIPKHVHHLTERKISIVRAATGHGFYCSDNPVVLYNPFPYLRVGFGGVGTEICFPISKNLLLCFTCATTARKIEHTYHKYRSNGIEIPEEIERLYRGLYLQQIVTMDSKFVDFFNHLQVRSSSRFLYSATAEFGVAKGMIEQAPDLKEVKSQRTLGQQPLLEMQDGKYIVFHFKDKDHTLIRVEHIDNSHELRFKVSTEDRWKIEFLYRSKEVIDFVQTFENKMERRGMRDVEITSFDTSSGLVVISHQDKGMAEILKHMMAEKAKRQKKD